MVVMPLRSLTVACLVAMTAFMRHRYGSGIALTGDAGSPPRFTSNRYLANIEDTLKQVRASSSGIPALEFMQASYAIVSIMDAIPGMGLIKQDMVGNADHIWRRLGGDATTLEAMCAAELATMPLDKARSKDGTVVTSLLWLKRALQFLQGLLKEMLRSPQKTLRQCCSVAYESSLKRHHNMVMRGTFHVATNVAPPRDEFLAKLTIAGSGEAAAVKALSKLVPAWGTLLERLDAFLVRERIER